jgi:hypothetical protein
MSHAGQGECAIRNRSLTSDTGVVADAEWYPYALVCSNRQCTLLGNNLRVSRGVGAVTVEVAETGERHAADTCIRTRTQRY